MSKQTEALKLALEGLEKWHFDKDPRGADEYITAIREALAEQPAQDQGQSCYCPECERLSKELAALKAQQQQQEPTAYAVYHRMGGSKSLHWPEQHSEDGDHNECQLVPLYTSPPASKPFDTHAAPGQSFDTHSRTPQPSKALPLTDEQILRLVPGLQDCLCDPWDYNNSGDDYASIPKDMIRLARAIEAAHQIGEQK